MGRKSKRKQQLTAARKRIHLIDECCCGGSGHQLIEGWAVEGVVTTLRGVAVEGVVNTLRGGVGQWREWSTL